MTFEQYWASNGVVLAGQPGILAEAFKEVAKKAWDAAIASRDDEALPHNDFDYPPSLPIPTTKERAKAAFETYGVVRAQLVIRDDDRISLVEARKRLLQWAHEGHWVFRDSAGRVTVSDGHLFLPEFIDQV